MKMTRENEGKAHRHLDGFGVLIVGRGVTRGSSAAVFAVFACCVIRRIIG